MVLFGIGFWNSQEDRTSFQRIVKANYLKMYYVALRWVKDSVIAEEVVYEVLLMMAKDFSRYCHRTRYEIESISILLVENECDKILVADEKDQFGVILVFKYFHEWDDGSIGRVLGFSQERLDQCFEAMSVYEDEEDFGRMVCQLHEEEICSIPGNRFLEEEYILSDQFFQRISSIIGKKKKKFDWKLEFE